MFEKRNNTDSLTPSSHSHPYLAPPMTPPPNRVSSILPEDLKPRAGTVADILLTVGGEGGGGLGGVGGVVGGEVGPGESPRIRSFTLVAPLRQKPE